MRGQKLANLEESMALRARVLELSKQGLSLTAIMRSAGYTSTNSLRSERPLTTKGFERLSKVVDDLEAKRKHRTEPVDLGPACPKCGEPGATFTSPITHWANGMKTVYRVVTCRAECATGEDAQGEWISSLGKKIYHRKFREIIEGPTPEPLPATTTGGDMKTKQKPGRVEGQEAQDLIRRIEEMRHPQATGTALAEALGVGESTLRKALKDQSFSAALAERIEKGLEYYGEGVGGPANPAPSEVGQSNLVNHLRSKVAELESELASEKTRHAANYERLHNEHAARLKELYGYIDTSSAEWQKYQELCDRERLALTRVRESLEIRIVTISNRLERVVGAVDQVSEANVSLSDMLRSARTFRDRTVAVNDRLTARNIELTERMAKLEEIAFVVEQRPADLFTRLNGATDDELRSIQQKAQEYASSAFLVMKMATDALGNRVVL